MRYRMESGKAVIWWIMEGKVVQLSVRWCFLILPVPSISLWTVTCWQVLSVPMVLPGLPLNIVGVNSRQWLRPGLCRKKIFCGNRIFSLSWNWEEDGVKPEMLMSVSMAGEHFMKMRTMRISLPPGLHKSGMTVWNGKLPNRSIWHLILDSYPTSGFPEL